MVSSKSMAIVVSGLAITGTAALGLGLSPADAMSMRWGHGHGCCGRQASYLSGHGLNLNRHHQRIIIVNRINLSNVTRNNNDTRQRLNPPRDAASANASAAAAG